MVATTIYLGHYRYEAPPPGEDVSSNKDYLRRQFLRLGQSAEQFAYPVATSYQPLNEEPNKPRNGLVFYVDGATWNPGSGAGFYQYQNSASYNRFVMLDELAPYLTSASAALSTYVTSASMSSAINPFLTSGEIAALYMSSAVIASTYMTSASIASRFASASAITPFLTSGQIASIYMSSASIASRFMSATSLASYLTSASAVLTFLNSAAVQGMLVPYLTSGSAATQYMSATSLASYLTSASASSDFMPVGAIVYAVKPTDQTISSSASLFLDGDLAVSLAASSIYAIDGFLVYQMAALSQVNMQLEIGGTGSSSGRCAFWDRRAGTANAGTFNYFSDSSANATDGATVGVNLEVMITGVLETASAGAAGLRWAQGTSDASDLILRRNSWLRFTYLGLK